jgi:hypothetical protein
MPVFVYKQTTCLHMRKDEDTSMAPDTHPVGIFAEKKLLCNQ